MEHRIEITHAKLQRAGEWVGHGTYSTLYNGEIIGTWRTPECDGARYLLSAGLARPDDRLTVCRGGSPCLAGSVGWFADRTVQENEKISPRWTKWRPFSMAPKDSPEKVCGRTEDGQKAPAATHLPPEAGEAA
jgi:hypothetical protein